MTQTPKSNGINPTTDCSAGLFRMFPTNLSVCSLLNKLPSENTTKTRPARHLYGRNVEMETRAGVATEMGLPDRQSQYKQLLRIKLLHSVNIYARGRGEGPVVTWRIQLYFPHGFYVKITFMAFAYYM